MVGNGRSPVVKRERVERSPNTREPKRAKPSAGAGGASLRGADEGRLPKSLARKNSASADERFSGQRPSRRTTAIRRLTGSIFDHISGAIVSPFQFSGNGWYSVNG